MRVNCNHHWQPQRNPTIYEQPTDHAKKDSLPLYIELLWVKSNRYGSIWFVCLRYSHVCVCVGETT